MRRLFGFAATLAFFFSIPAHAQVPEGFEKVDREITIKTLKAQMKYDTELVQVSPGDKVKLTLENADDLPHNLVVATPGPDKGADKGKAMADAVLQMGDKMLDAGFVPLGHPRMLAHSGLVNPQEKSTIYFTVPKEEGRYPLVCTYPGHWALMNAIMEVGETPPDKPGTAGPLSGLTWKAYGGNWKQLPDFEKLTPYKTGKAQKIDIAVAGRGDQFGVVWTGTFHAPKSGEYLFAVASDDGSRLWIDGKDVCSKDGIHPTQRGEGKITLDAGEHAFKVAYFEGGGQQELYVGFKAPGGSETALSKGGKKGGSAAASGIPIIPPLNEATIYRNFIEGAGPRAIGVGFSESQNYAFNANSMNIPLLWQGAFMDGAKHWKGRGQGFQPPNSSTVAKFDETVAPFAYLASESDAWPNELQPGEPANRPVGFKFKGYELDKKRNPLFLYNYGDVQVREKMIPSATGMTRRLAFSGAKENLYFCVGRAKEITGAGRKFVNGPLTIKLPVDGMLKDGAIIVPLKTTTNGRGYIEISYSWK